MSEARGLLLVMIGIDPAHEEELNRWYDEEHFPERLACPGFLKGRRFTAVQGAPKYLALYDLESPAVLDSAAYRHAAGPAATPLTRRMQTLFNPIIRNIYVEIHHQVAAPPG